MIDISRSVSTFAFGLYSRIFTSLWNVAITVVLAALAIWGISSILAWAIFDANFAGASRDACVGGGACWTFVKVRFNQFVYGFYPPGEYWRVNAAGLIAAALLLIAIFPRVPYRAHICSVLLIVAAPVVWVLLYGGAFGLPVVRTADWGGLLVTLFVATTAMLLAVPLGVLLALGRQSKFPAIAALATIYIECIRAVPLITILFMASVMLPLFLPDGVAPPEKLVRAVLGIALFNAAYVAEVVRGGMRSVAAGQYEAAKSLGLGYWRSTALIILPQALRNALPGLLGTLIGLFKDTTLLFIIGVFDVLGMVQVAVGDANWVGLSAEGYVFVAAFFWTVCFGMSQISRRIEKRFARERH